ncbi:MAG: hypothetical protein HY942_04115 [Gammaproteobacteria bacterium]|nr:hypothetical protein [Gammaproteobacteria bacterium]
MKTPAITETNRAPLKVILLAGLCGGLAEVVWVQLYASLAGLSGAEVARQVTASLMPGAAEAAFAPGLGIAIHFVLSLLVAVCYATLVWVPFMQRRGPAASVAAASVVLATIWAVNFLAVLPVVNPEFIGLLPYPVTFGSKLLFGLAMAAVLAGVPRSRGVRYAPR